VKDRWMKSDGIDPIAECSSDSQNHQDVKIVVTSAGWDFLGEHGKRKAFAQSVAQAFKPHWRTFHGWDGSKPEGQQVHVFRVDGLDVKLAALTSASGFYAE
jgi:hypothetical protein